MVKNTLGGYKGKTFARKFTNTSSSSVRLPEDELETFGCVHKLLGNGRVLVYLLNGKEMQCVIRNKFRGRSKRNNLINIGTFVLIGLHDWEKPNYKSGDVLTVYSYDDVMYLKSLPQYNLTTLDSFLYNLNPDKHTSTDFEFSTEEQTEDVLPPNKLSGMDSLLPPDEEEIDFDNI